MASDLKAKLPDFDHVPQPYTGISKEEVLKQRKEHLSPAIFHYYKEPIMVVEGKMQVRKGRHRNGQSPPNLEQPSTSLTSNSSSVTHSIALPP